MKEENKISNEMNPVRGREGSQRASASNGMKILICTGIYPPDIGGPAKYAKNLKEEFEKRNFTVRVLAYKLEKKLPIGIRHLLYFFRVIANLNKTDLIISLDTFSVSFPAVLATKIFKKKIIIRVGGDSLWETYVEKTGDLITLEEFYEHMPKLPFKHQMIYILQKFTLKNASALAFNTEWQKDLFQKAYQLDPGKLFIIENYYGVKDEDISTKEKIFLFAGRKIKFKNLQAIEEIFHELRREKIDIKLEIIDNLNQAQLGDKIRSSYALIVPSISDFAPNFIIEGISLNKPFILTQNCGLTEKLKDLGLFVDPFNKQDIKNKILMMSDDKVYPQFKENIRKFSYTHLWPEIAGEFLGIYKKL